MMESWEEIRHCFRQLNEQLDRLFASGNETCSHNYDPRGEREMTNASLEQTWETLLDNLMDRLGQFKIAFCHESETETSQVYEEEGGMYEEKMEMEIPIKEEVPEIDQLEEQELADFVTSCIGDYEANPMGTDSYVSSKSFNHAHEGNDVGGEEVDEEERRHRPPSYPRKKFVRRNCNSESASTGGPVEKRPQNTAKTPVDPEPTCDMKAFTLVVKRMTRSEVKKYTSKKIAERQRSPKVEAKDGVSKPKVASPESRLEADPVFDIDIDEYESDGSDYVPCKKKSRVPAIGGNKRKEKVEKESSSRKIPTSHKKESKMHNNSSNKIRSGSGALPAGTELTQEQITINEQIKAFDWTTLEGPIFQCVLCPYKSNRRRVLGRHLKRHKFEVGLECPVCFMQPFKNQFSLRNHVKKKHSSEYKSLYVTTESLRLRPEDYGFVEDDLKNEDVDGVRNPKYPFKCPVCGAPRPTRTTAIYHISSHDPSTSHGLCTHCGKTFPALSLNAHIKSQHPEETDKTYNCPDPLCSKSFPSKERLRRHAIYAHRSLDEEAIPAYIKDFESKRGKIKLGPLTCVTCGEKFISRSALKNHKSRHAGFSNGERRLPFRCEFPGCSKQFAQKGNFKKHQTVHNADGNVKCTECDISFKNSYTLYQHKLRCHPKERETKFVCSRCPEVFITQLMLTKHFKGKHLNPESATPELTSADIELNNRIHTFDIKGPPYNCFVCNHEAVGRQHLQRHLLNHLKEKPLTCPECNAESRHALTLKRHIYNIHRQEYSRYYGKRE